MIQEFQRRLSLANLAVGTCLVLLGLTLGLAAPTVARAWPGFGDTSAAPQCDDGAELMAVLYNDKAPARSVAMVANKKDNSRLVGVGSWVDGRPVLAVVPEALWLGPAETPCWIPLNHEGHQRVKKRHKKRKKRKKRKRRRRRKR